MLMVFNAFLCDRCETKNIIATYDCQRFVFDSYGKKSESLNCGVTCCLRNIQETAKRNLRLHWASVRMQNVGLAVTQLLLELQAAAHGVACPDIPDLPLLVVSFFFAFQGLFLARHFHGLGWAIGCSMD